MIALPLLVGDQPIGLLAVYPRRRRPLTANESALLVALAAQLAVVVQNARLHERATRLGVELESALASEREAAGRVQALYEISRSFAQSLSLDATLDELAKSIVNLLGVDAAVIRMPDERGAELQARAIHVVDERVDAAVRALLSRPQTVQRARARPARARDGRWCSTPRRRVAWAAPRRFWRRSSRRGPAWRSCRSRSRASCSRRSRSSRSTRAARSRASWPRPRSRLPARPRSRSTTHVSTRSRRRSPTRCSGRSCRARRHSCPGSSSATSTSPRRGSTSAATSTTT